MVKNELFVRRVRKAIAILLIASRFACAGIGIPQQMGVDKYVEKVEFEAPVQEKLPQREDFEPNEIK